MCCKLTVFSSTLVVTNASSCLQSRLSNILPEKESTERYGRSQAAIGPVELLSLLQVVFSCPRNIAFSIITELFMTCVWISRGHLKQFSQEKSPRVINPELQNKRLGPPGASLSKNGGRWNSGVSLKFVLPLLHQSSNCLHI